LSHNNNRNNNSSSEVLQFRNSRGSAYFTLYGHSGTDDNFQ